MTNNRKSKKLRKIYHEEMRKKAEKDTHDLQVFLSNKSFKYRFDLAWKILFRTGLKKGVKNVRT